MTGASARLRAEDNSETPLNLMNHLPPLTNVLGLWRPERPERPRFHVPGKRAYDVVFSLAGLIVLSPLFALIALAVRLTDGGRVIYRQKRVGLEGRPFWICKFRTMVHDADRKGPAVTKDGDDRITTIGRVLRKTKLDELPQLWNVLKGEMSLVGPRPEVPRYVRHYTPEQREVLHCKPGITDLASISFRDEERWLGDAAELEEFYLRQCMPRKLELNREYARRASLWSDTWIILQTLCPYWVGVLILYGFVLMGSYGLSYALVHDFTLPAMVAAEWSRELLIVLAFQLGCLSWRTQCRGLLSYFTSHEAVQIGTALSLAAVGLLGWSAVMGSGPTRPIILVDALVSLLAIGGFRFLLRRWRERTEGEETAHARRPVRVGIIGAGSTGAQLALELNRQRRWGRCAVAFFDDDARKWNKRIHDVPVAGMPECLLNGWADRLDEVVLALPRASEGRIREIHLVLRQIQQPVYASFFFSRLWNAESGQNSRSIPTPPETAAIQSTS